MVDLKQFIKFFDPETISLSEPYVAHIEAKDIDVRALNDGVELKARVSDTQSYVTTVWFSNDEQDMDAKCSCPVTYDCKHAVALLSAADGHQVLLGFNPKRSDSAPTEVDEVAKIWLNQLRNSASDYASKHGLNPEPLLETSPFIYILQPSAAYLPRDLKITVKKVRRLKSGQIATAKEWDGLYGAAHDNSIAATDRRLMAALLSKKINHGAMSFGQNALMDMPAAVLQEMSQTKRFYWLNHDTAAVFWQDTPYVLDFEWDEPTDDETVQLRAIWIGANDEFVNLDEMYIIPSNPLTFFDSQTQSIGLLKSRFPSEMLASLLQAPTMPMGMLMDLGLTQNVMPKNSSALESVVLARVDYHGGMQPILVTHSAPPAWHAEINEPPHGFANIAFAYGGGTVPFSQSGETFKGEVDGVKVTQHRNRDLERQHVQLLMESLKSFTGEKEDKTALFIEDAGVLRAPLSDWVDVLIEPDFFANIGWEVHHAQGSPLDIHLASVPNLTLSENDGEGNDWFSLGMHIEASGVRYNLSDLLGSLIQNKPQLLDASRSAAIPDDEYLYVNAADGQRIALRMADVRPILVHIADLFSQPSQDGELQIDQFDAMRLLELQHTLGLAYAGNGRLEKLAEVFRRGLESHHAAPEGFVGTLRPYQEKGLAWLQFLRETEHGGILADDMGLGKTAQTLAHLLTEKNAGRLDLPVLIVAPTSLMHNWCSEAARFTPSLKVLVLQGASRVQHFEHFSEYDVILTTYPLLPRDETTLLSYRYHSVILDEAQNIKNPIAKASQIARKIVARHRIALTGTPMENHLGELWSLFHFVMPGFLGSQDLFNKRFRFPIEKQNHSLAKTALIGRIRPFMLRRRKTEVATELPPKTTTVVQIDMGSAQQKLYEAIRAAMQAKIQLQVADKGFKRSHIEILDALLKLRQVCCHPLLLKLDTVKKDVESAKLNALVDMVVEMVEEGRRILIFSQFTSMLSLIEEALMQNDIGLVKLTGQTKKRQEVIEQFQKGEVPVFLISLKAGGVGLNLTAADTVIHYDPWWNPAAEEQASDRAWRIGQDKPVFVYKLIIAGSIEEKIIEMQQRKAALTNSVISDDTEQTVKFSEEDLLNLFAPMP